ncbi:MAG: metallophosphoesterase [Betaproteobacteria bacterium]
MNYDIIGDIHGHADKLVALLRKLGYRDHGGAWRHPDRTAIFVGDFIDRGPGQLDTINIVRRMVDAQTAQAVMGNHEFNAIAWHTQDPGQPGAYLRPRNEKNRGQTAAFLAEVEGDPDVHREVIKWFYKLPLWLDLPELRVVHACWRPASMAEIEPLLKPGRLLDPALVIAASRKGTMEYRAVEAIIKGLEIDLPPGHEFLDKDGQSHNRVRVRWWDITANTYRKAAIIDAVARDALPDTPIPAASSIGYDSPKPVFFGHYWFSGVPAPEAPCVASVDYSVGNGGPLMAYRWEGEPALQASGFIGV